MARSATRTHQSRPTPTPTNTPNGGVGPVAPVPQWASAPQWGRELLVATAVALGAITILALWWHDASGAPTNIAGFDVTEAGRIAGLLGSYMVLVAIVLMARVPWLENLIGAGRLSVWHRRNGQLVVVLLVSHVLLILWGYTLMDHANPFSETRTLELSYPDVAASTVGLALLLVVGATSARAARARLGYHAWYFVHLYTYLAVALAFSHQLANGTDFATHLGNRALWVTLYASVAVTVAWYRLGVPVKHALLHQLRVQRVERETPGVVSVYVTGRRLDEMGLQAGQFIRWRFLTREGWWQSHPFSLSAAPNNRYLRFTVKAVGDHTHELRYLRPGTRVLTEGVHGAFTSERRTRDKVLLIGGGIGITPLRALFESLPAKPGDLTLIYRASSEEELVFRNELNALARKRDAKVYYVLGSRDARPDPLRPSQLRELVPGLSDHEAYVCGPVGLNERVVKSLRAAGVPRRHIHTEGFSL
jgi:predicted ferric reductase